MCIRDRCKVEKKREYDIDPIFKACKGTTEETLNMIRKYYKNHNYVLDPHSALGVLAAEKVKSNTPTICLATAHPAKFPNTINDAIGMNATHEVLETLKGRPTQFDKVENDVDSVKQYLVDKLNNS